MKLIKFWVCEVEKYQILHIAALTQTQAGITKAKHHMPTILDI